MIAIVALYFPQAYKIVVHLSFITSISDSVDGYGSTVATFAVWQNNKFRLTMYTTTHLRFSTTFHTHLD